MWLAESNPAQRTAVAKAGVMWALLQCFNEAADYAWAMPKMGPVWSLARLLLSEDWIARRDLRKAICWSLTVPHRAFTALYILYECLLTSNMDIRAAPNKEDILDALVFTLDDDWSPYCVAAAAADLSLLCRTSGGGRGWLGSSGAIPALVRVIERGRPPADRKTGLYQRTRLAFKTGSSVQVIGFENPTAMALGALLTILSSRPWPCLDSILETGGVPALVRLLKDSKCPQTAIFTAMLIEVLLDPMATGPCRFADRLFESGLCQSALQVLSVQNTAVRGWVLLMLSKFCDSLSDHSRPAAMAELVAGNAVELSVGLLTEAGLNVPEAGLNIFCCFFEDPGARERICGPAVADQLIKWSADLLPEADGPDILRILRILGPLLELSPYATYAGTKPNLVPGLVCALRKLQNAHAFEDCLSVPIERPLLCLKNLLWADMGGTGGLWKAATKAGIVLVLEELLTRGHDSTRVLCVVVSELLLMATPQGEVGSWGVGLLCAVAQLLGAASPAPRVAAEMLYKTGLVHPELFVDCRTWGFDDAVRRLMMDSDPDTAAAALKLNNYWFVNKAPDLKGDSAGGGLVNRSASTSTLPNPTVTSGLDPTLMRSDGRHSPEAGPCASHKQGKLSVAPVPESPAECSSRASASPGRFGGHVVRACARCGMRTEKRKLKECSACRSVRYCGKACQTADWPGHKATCKRLQAACQ